MGASWKLLRAARLLLGLTQRELAEEARVSRGSVDRLERGERGHSRIDDAVQAVLERHGIRFIPETETSGGGLMLPPALGGEQASPSRSDAASKSRVRGYVRRRSED